MKVGLVVCLFFCLFMISCGNENADTESTVKNNETTSDTDEDTLMSPEELFSSSLLQNTGNEDDLELQVYLEEQIYPVASKSGKVALDKISATLYLLTYDENGKMKNFLIRRFYDAIKEEYVFEKTETDSNVVRHFFKITE